jgi:hypothetical protein
MVCRVRWFAGGLLACWLAGYCSVALISLSSTGCSSARAQSGWSHMGSNTVVIIVSEPASRTNYDPGGRGTGGRPFPVPLFIFRPVGLAHGSSGTRTSRMAWTIHQSKQGNNWGLRDEGRKKVGDRRMNPFRDTGKRNETRGLNGERGDSVNVRCCP